MAKPPGPLRPARLRAKPTRAPMRNSRLGAQTRKILSKHYRSKHGVR